MSLKGIDITSESVFSKDDILKGIERLIIEMDKMESDNEGFTAYASSPDIIVVREFFADKARNTLEVLGYEDIPSILDEETYYSLYSNRELRGKPRRKTVLDDFLIHNTIKHRRDEKIPNLEAGTKEKILIPIYEKSLKMFESACQQELFSDIFSHIKSLEIELGIQVGDDKDIYVWRKLFNDYLDEKIVLKKVQFSSFKLKK